ncbi:MAG: SDR family oxidoreductase [Desulfobulbaceae bacterium]|nr:SDR family oxidoreductase [Desulfobulbaceae bacterium]
MDIHGARALVPGAARGIGRAIARLLVSKGVRLVLPWYDWPESVASLQEEFGGTGQHVLVQADLRQKNDVARLCREIVKELGGLEILINNIERGGMPIVHGDYSRKVNEAQWQRELDTTLQAKWLLWRHTLPLLRKAAQAAVVNISSIAGLVGRSGPVGVLFSDGYALANRAVTGLTEQWAREGAPTIRVNELMLGLVDSRHGPETRGWQALSLQQRNALYDHTLLGRTANPDEVAKTVLFLVRDADYCTGSVLRMDGGYLLGGEKNTEMPPGVLE